MKKRFETAAAALALLAACERPAGGREEEAPPQPEPEAAPAQGKAEEGRFSMKGPGFDFKIDIPEGVRGEGGENPLLYPGAVLAGMHIEAEPKARGGAAGSGVELRFTSADPPEKVAAWYRDPARKGSFSVASEARDAGALVLSGTQADGGDAFTLRLAPAPDGGSAGRLTLSERG